MTVAISILSAGVVTFVVMIVSLIFVHRLWRWVEEYSGVENLTSRLYLAWILLGAALFCGLFIGTRSLLESLFGN